MSENRVKLDLELIEWAIRNGKTKHLWIYSILRQRGKDSGGYSRRESGSIGNLSVRQTQRYIKELKEMRWVSVTRNSYKAISILKIREAFEIRSRGTVYISGSLLSNYDRFLAHIFTGKVETMIKMQKRMLRKKGEALVKSGPENTIPAVTRLLTAAELSEAIGTYQQGQVSLSVISNYLGIPRSTVANYKKIAKREGKMKVESVYHILISQAEADTAMGMEIPYLRHICTRDGHDVIAYRSSDKISTNVELSRRRRDRDVEKVYYTQERVDKYYCKRSFTYSFNSYLTNNMGTLYYNT